MKTHAPAWLCLLLVFAFTLLAGGRYAYADTPSAPVVTREVFERVASELEFFDLNPFLYNRDGLNFHPEDPGIRTRYFTLLKKVLEDSWTVPDILLLCSHPNPRVRTLAIAALFHRNDPHLLPYYSETFEGQRANVLRPWAFIGTGVRF